MTIFKVDVKRCWMTISLFNFLGELRKNNTKVMIDFGKCIGFVFASSSFQGNFSIIFFTFYTSWLCYIMMMHTSSMQSSWVILIMFKAAYRTMISLNCISKWQCITAALKIIWKLNRAQKSRFAWLSKRYTHCNRNYTYF